MDSPARQVVKAWMPWVILSVLVFVWGLPQVKDFLDAISRRVPDRRACTIWSCACRRSCRSRRRRPRCTRSIWLSATGTGILIAAIIAGLCDGLSPAETGADLRQDAEAGPVLAAHHRRDAGARLLTKYAGLDATLGLAFAHTGWFYPFFGTMLGWLGVALTGSDTSSNVLFGGLQKITAEQLGL